MRISQRATGVISAIVFAGAVGIGTAAQAETDWDALSTSEWGGKQTEDAEKIAQASAGRNLSAEIQKAFLELGMAGQRAECYGKVLAEQLSPEEQQEAVQLVSEATSADDVKMSVLTGGSAMVGGFSAADASCPESMGG